jgi:hypothetical protein
MFQIMVGLTGLVAVAVCWLTRRCGFAAAGSALTKVAQPLAAQGGGDLIEVDDPSAKVPPDGQQHDQ